MKHGSLISPDEAPFGFGASNAATIETISTHSDGADFVTVPDAHLLFSGEFKHSGNDLKIVGEDGKSFLVTDYFKNDKRPTLSSPEGATLSGDIVDLLAGPLAPGQYAQAGAPQPSANEAVGRVAVVTGNVTIIRNGVTVTVNAGDTILKNDVVQTGAGATCGLALNDGSTFNLTGGARLAINEFVYDPNGTANASLTTLIQGAATFVAGQIAKTGDMKVATPVATMGIRGTAVLVEISANNGQTKFSVMVEPNGEVGSFNLYDKSTGSLLATVNSSSIGWVVTPTGPLQVLAQQVQKTPAELARELFIMQQVFQTFNSGPFDPNAPQPPQQPNDPNRRGDTDTNPKAAGGPGTQIQPSDTGPIIHINITPPIGANGQTGPGATGTASQPNNPADGPTGPGDPGGPTGPGGPTQTQTLPIHRVYGSANNDNPLAGSDNDDMVFGGAGDDIFIAAHGKGNDFFDGDGDGDNPELPDFEGPGFDTIRYDSASGVTFDLVGITELNHAFSASTGYDTFINIEKVVGSPGDDTFNTDANDAWHLDGSDGFDTIVVKGAVDISADIELENIEVIDLNTTNADTFRLDGADALEAVYGKNRLDDNETSETSSIPTDDNETGYLKIEGSEGDRVNLSNDDRAGKWSSVEGDGEGCPPQKDGYALYVFRPYGGGDDAYVYIKDGIAVDIAPEVNFPRRLISRSTATVSPVGPASTQIDNAPSKVGFAGTARRATVTARCCSTTAIRRQPGMASSAMSSMHLTLSGLAGGQNVDLLRRLAVSQRVVSCRARPRRRRVPPLRRRRRIRSGLRHVVNDVVTETTTVRPITLRRWQSGPTQMKASTATSPTCVWDIVRTEQQIADAQSGSSPATSLALPATGR